MTRKLTWENYWIKTKNPTLEELKLELDRIASIQKTKFVNNFYDNGTCTKRQQKINILKNEIKKLEKQ